MSILVPKEMDDPATREDTELEYSTENVMVRQAAHLKRGGARYLLSQKKR